jgi:hypothetical protein
MNELTIVSRPGPQETWDEWGRVYDFITCRVVQPRRAENGPYKYPYISQNEILDMDYEAASETANNLLKAISVYQKWFGDIGKI